MATYHQHFNFDKFVRIINSDLFRGYFDTKDVALPSGINLNSPEEVKNLLLSLEQEKRLGLNEELQKIYDIAERGRNVCRGHSDYGVYEGSSQDVQGAAKTHQEGYAKGQMDNHD